MPLFLHQSKIEKIRKKLCFAYRCRFFRRNIRIVNWSRVAWTAAGGNIAEVRNGDKIRLIFLIGTIELCNSDRRALKQDVRKRYQRPIWPFKPDNQNRKVVPNRWRHMPAWLVPPDKGAIRPDWWKKNRETNLIITLRKEKLHFTKLNLWKRRKEFQRKR